MRYLWYRERTTLGHGDISGTENEQPKGMEISLVQRMNNLRAWRYLWYRE